MVGTGINKVLPKALGVREELKCLNEQTFWFCLQESHHDIAIKSTDSQVLGAAKLRGPAV